MSYTKFSKEVTKWLKDNGLPCYGTANDSPEETKARLDAWMHGSKEILRQWITEKRYRELISCAHGGWYQDDVIFEPLAEHFVANHLFDELRFLCERGIRTFEKYTRNTLDLSAVPLIHEKTHLPIIVDPSHATGKANLVEPMMIAAVAAGADGLEVEVHYDPQHAWSDGAQCLTPDSFAQAMAKCRQVAWAIGRDM